MKGIPTEAGFEEVPKDEIIRGYEHSKGQHVLLRSEEIDDLKLEAKHTIDMVRFVDAAEIDSRYWEKPYYLTADGDDQQRAPEVTIEKKGKHAQVINIMDGLKKSIQAEGRTKVASSVRDKLGEGRERLGKVATFEPPK